MREISVVIFLHTVHNSDHTLSETERLEVTTLISLITVPAKPLYFLYLLISLVTSNNPLITTYNERHFKSA